MEKSSKLSRQLIILASFVLVALSGWMPAAAEQAEPRFTMTVIVDEAHGGKVAAGRYQSAISRITASRRIADPFAKHTNLCVAYTKIGDVEAATQSCETALDLVRKEGQRKTASYMHDRRQRRYLALALSNLGVLDAAKGLQDLARNRFEEAIDLDTGVSAPRINLGRLIVGL